MKLCYDVICCVLVVVSVCDVCCVLYDVRVLLCLMCCLLFVVCCVTCVVWNGWLCDCNHFLLRFSCGFVVVCDALFDAHCVVVLIACCFCLMRVVHCALL